MSAFWQCQARANIKRDNVHNLGAGGTMPLMDRFHTEVMSAFSKRLQTARKAAGYETAKEFAEALGVEENRYRHWERGSAQPNLTMLTRISRLLKVEVQELLPLGYKRRDGNNSSPISAAG
jgi:DNA-binding XRE family transcriptional regulator